MLLYIGRAVANSIPLRRSINVSVSPPAQDGFDGPAQLRRSRCRGWNLYQVAGFRIAHQSETRLLIAGQETRGGNYGSPGCELLGDRTAVVREWPSFGGFNPAHFGDSRDRRNGRSRGAELARSIQRIRTPPEGFRVDEIPDAISLNSQFGRCRAKWTSEGQTIVSEQKLEIDAQTVPAERHGELKKFLDIAYGAAGRDDLQVGCATDREMVEIPRLGHSERITVCECSVERCGRRECANRRPIRKIKPKAVQRAAGFAFPTTDIETMLEQIERGYER